MSKEKIILINHHAKMTLPEWFSKAKIKDVETIVNENIIPYLLNQPQDYGFY